MVLSLFPQRTIESDVYLKNGQDVQIMKERLIKTLKNWLWALAVICFYFTQLDNGKYLQSPWRFWKNERERLLSVQTLFYLWCARLLLLWYNAIRFARPRNLLEKNIHFHPVRLVSQVAKYRVDINYSRNSMTASYLPVLSASMFYTHPSPRSTPQDYHEPKNACRNQV